MSKYEFIKYYKRTSILPVIQPFHIQDAWRVYLKGIRDGKQSGWVSLDFKQNPFFTFELPKKTKKFKIKREVIL